MRTLTVLFLLSATCACADPPKKPPTPLPVLPPMEQKDLDKILQASLPDRVPPEVFLAIRNAQLEFQLLVQRAGKKYQFDADQGDDVDLRTGVITRAPRGPSPVPSVKKPPSKAAPPPKK